MSYESDHYRRFLIKGIQQCHQRSDADAAKIDINKLQTERLRNDILRAATSKIESAVNVVEDESHGQRYLTAGVAIVPMTEYNALLDALDNQQMRASQLNARLRGT